jgi:hypothetical protein
MPANAILFRSPHCDLAAVRTTEAPHRATGNSLSQLDQWQLIDPQQASFELSNGA